MDLGVVDVEKNFIIISSSIIIIIIIIIIPDVMSALEFADLTLVPSVGVHKYSE